MRFKRSAWDNLIRQRWALGQLDQRMEEDYWVKTQRVLQGSDPLVKRPKLTEALLKRPPFRFLHDVICEVVRRTGFAEGLFTPVESVASELKDKDAKVAYLAKIINCVGITLGANVPVRPIKILAGLEPERTNIFLQMLASAASADSYKHQKAVASCLAGETMPSSGNQGVQAETPEETCISEEVDSIVELPAFKHFSDGTGSSTHSASSEKIRRSIYSPPADIGISALSGSVKEVRVTAGYQDAAEVCQTERDSDGRLSCLQDEYHGKVLDDGGWTEGDVERRVQVASIAGIRSQLVKHSSSKILNTSLLEYKRNDLAGQETARKKKDCCETGSVLGEITAGIEAETEEKREELQRLRVNIQELCQAISPLGKCIDYLQEDAEAMAKEYQLWNKEHQIQQCRLEEECKKTEDLLQSESSKLLGLENEIRSQQQRNYKIKAQIFGNDEALVKIMQAASTAQPSTVSE